MPTKRITPGAKQAPGSGPSLAEREAQALAARSALAEYMRGYLASEQSPENRLALGMRGDIAALRGLFQAVNEAWFRGQITTHTQETTGLVLDAMRVLRRLNEQPDTVLRQAFGLASMRKQPAHVLRDRVLYYAVDHCMFGMGEVRAFELACAMVADATDEVFGESVSAENVQRIFSRQKAADPNGNPWDAWPHGEPDR